MYQNKNRLSLFLSFVSVKFLLSACILVLAAIGLRPGIRAISERYMKKTIDIRRSLKEFDLHSLPSFEEDWEITRGKPNVSLEAIGTEECLILHLKRRIGTPKSTNIAVTYYSNPQDKVPHTPQMCYTQIGAIIKETMTVTIDTPELDPDYAQIHGRMVIFDMPKSDLDRVILYCFCVEGKFRSSRTGVRLVMGQPGNRYTYFCKIEAISDYPNDEDPSETIEICKRLFREIILVLLTEYFPEKKDLRGP